MSDNTHPVLKAPAGRDALTRESRLERLLYRKLDVWQVLILMLVALLVMASYGGFVHRATKRPDLFDTPVGRALMFVAALPENISLILAEKDAMKVRVLPQGDFEPGWDWRLPPGDANLSGHLLLSRYDGDIDRSVVDLIDLASQTTLHSWSGDFGPLLEPLRDGHLAEYGDVANWSTRRFRIIHPMLTSDGSLLVKSHGSPLMRLSPCGEASFVADNVLLHHSMEATTDGTFWAPGRRLGTNIPQTSDDFADDTIVRFTAGGDILFERSMAEVMIDHGYEWFLFSYGGYEHDALHLNDVQPVPGDGPHWQAGDVFVSARHPSLIFLYRPSEDRIIWAKHGPLTAQHDVEIIDDHRIGIFNNNSTNRGKGLINDGLELMVYDFRTDDVSVLFGDETTELGLKSLAEGLFDYMPGGGVMIEAGYTGRLVILDGNGKLVGQFLNRYDDGDYYPLSWSRYIPSGRADEAIAALRDAPC